MSIEFDGRMSYRQMAAPSRAIIFPPSLAWHCISESNDVSGSRAHVDRNRDSSLQIKTSFESAANSNDAYYHAHYRGCS
jgi:hypothetical protein